MGVIFVSFGPELVYEWNKMLETIYNHKVQKIYGGCSWCTLSFSSTITLLLSWKVQNCGITFINNDNRKKLIGTVKQTHPIIGALKRHLHGTELLTSQQIKRDRILMLTFKKTFGAGFHNKKHLVLEAIQNHGNFILIEDDGIIIEAAKHIYPSENRERIIASGHQYIFPAEYKGITLEEWLEKPRQESLKNIKGIGAPLLKTIFEMPLNEQKKHLSSFYSNTKNTMKIQKLNRYIFPFPVNLKNATVYNNLLASSTELVLDPILNKNADQRKRVINLFLTKEIARREKQISDISKLLKQDNSLTYKNYGNIILNNIQNIRRGEDRISLTSYTEAGEPETKEIPLNPALTATENADLYFKKYKKITASKERASKILEKVMNEMQDLNEDLLLAMCINDDESLSTIEKELKINRTKARISKVPNEKQFPPHKRIMLGDSIILIGLSAKGNRYATFKFARSNDIWFHAKDIPGAHVILRNNNIGEIFNDNQLLSFCASLAVYYSKSKDCGKVRVDYTLRKYVSPINSEIAGVTYREFKTLNVGSDFWEKYLLKNSQDLE